MDGAALLPHLLTEQEYNDEEERTAKRWKQTFYGDESTASDMENEDQDIPNDDLTDEQFEWLLNEIPPNGDPAAPAAVAEPQVQLYNEGIFTASFDVAGVNEKCNSWEELNKINARKLAACQRHFCVITKSSSPFVVEISYHESNPNKIKDTIIRTPDNTTKTYSNRYVYTLMKKNDSEEKRWRRGARSRPS